jgi:hypothetical protein
MCINILINILFMFSNIFDMILIGT